MGTSLSVFVPGLPLLRSPTVPHANAAVILPYCWSSRAGETPL